MDRNRFSYIAHGDMLLWNPVGPVHLQRYMRQLALAANSRILDIGCGRGHVLNLILAQSRASAIGVDDSPYAIADASRDLAAFVSTGRLTLIERPFNEREYDAASFDLIICIGATHAAGGYRATLRTARRLLHGRGMLLVGEGYWNHTPTQDYLDFLGMKSEDQSTHEGNQAAGIEEAFELVDGSECSLTEWDAYEEQYARNVEDYVKAQEHDPDGRSMLRRIRPWRDAYLRWGRDTLGFGLYLLRVRSGIVSSGVKRVNEAAP